MPRFALCQALSHVLSGWRLNSLQLRLTLGVALVSMVGVGSVAGLTSWRMQQILIASRKADVLALADRVAQDAAMYQASRSPAAALQRSLDNRTTADRVLWVRQSGQITAQSDMLTMSVWQRDGIAAELLARADRGRFQPGVARLGSQYFVLCAQPLQVAGTDQGMLFIADNITPEQRSLLALRRLLTAVSLIGWGLMAIAIAVYMRRSLAPLRRLSHQAGLISAQDLDHAALAVDAAPSEVQELAQAFNAMLHRLSIAWRQQRQLVGNVSHELRTPLTVVQGYIQSVLRRSPDLAPPQREGLVIAAAETDRTIQILQTLLDLARIEQGQLQLQLAPVAIDDLAAQLIARDPSFGDRVRLKLPAIAPSAATPEPAPVSSDLTLVTDAARLEEILRQLLHNAVQFSPPAQPIDVILQSTTTQMIIQVCDRGAGLPTAAQPHIF